jgi:NADH:ubiquinone reductase (H+-translocating)
MEQAARATDPEKRRQLLNIVIAGGGPTGVEVAGMLAEMAHHIAPKEYPEIPKIANPIYLIEAGSELLGPMSRKSQEEASRVLTKLGVQIKLNIAVKDYIDGSVILSNGEMIPTNVLIWTSGVIGREIAGLPPGVLGRARRVTVDEYNRVKGLGNVFAIGDIALQTSDPAYPNGHPMLAQVAIQQGKNLAENFRRSDEGRPMKAFVYHDKGSMAIISKYKAVVDLPKGFVKGFTAWLIWLFVHLIPITSFRNKVKLAFSWLWSFMTNDPTLRLIIRPEQPTETIHHEDVTAAP